MGETERRRRRLRQSPRPPTGGTPVPAPGGDSGPAPTSRTPHPHPREPHGREPHANAPVAEPAGPSVSTAPVHDPAPEEEEPPPKRPPARRGGNGGSDDREAERGLRGLIGSGASQVGTAAALRARDASRPTAQDEAEAEARLVVVRRNWVPREDLPRGR
jgi:hypothetical protein